MSSSGPLALPSYFNPHPSNNHGSGFQTNNNGSGFAPTNFAFADGNGHITNGGHLSPMYPSAALQQQQLMQTDMEQPSNSKVPSEPAPNGSNGLFPSDELEQPRNRRDQDHTSSGSCSSSGLFPSDELEEVLGVDDDPPFYAI